MFKKEERSRVWSCFLVAKAFSKFPRNSQFVGRVIPVWQTPTASANIGLIVNLWIPMYKCENFFCGTFLKQYVRREKKRLVANLVKFKRIIRNFDEVMKPLKCSYLMEIFSYQCIFLLLFYYFIIYIIIII